MKIEVLDGKNTIGGNKILIRTKSGSFFFDFGKNFKSWSDYFDDYLQPRVSAGIYDLWGLNLLPEFSNIYRDDLIPSDFRGVVEKEEAIDDLRGIFLTHAHLDHAGFISIIKEIVPIITSAISRKLLTAIQEIGGGSAFSQYNLVKEMEEVENEFRQTKIALKRNGKEIERTFVEINWDEFEGDIDGVKYRTFPVDHSIPGALAIYLEADGKSVVYTGDIRFHGANRQKSYDFVKKVKELKPDVLIAEGTRVPTLEQFKIAKKACVTTGFEDNRSKTEEDVYNASLEVVKQFDGKIVIADFGPRNVERLETFLRIAKETKRKIVITIKDAYLLHLLKSVGFKSIDDEDLLIISRKNELKRKWVTEIKKEYKSKIITLTDIKKNMGSFIVCYSFWDLANLLDIDIRGGAYIYSSSEAYSEEQIIDMKRLMNWMDHLNLKLFGISLSENGELSFSRDYHSSGHASFFDLIRMIEEINPKILIPVHTENFETYAEYFKDKGMKVIKSEMFEL
jgi:ribonuclease J